MRKSKKLMRFFGFLVGLVALTVVWLVVVKPIINSSDKDDDEVALQNGNGEENTNGGELGNAIVEGGNNNSGTGSGSGSNENSGNNQGGGSTSGNPEDLPTAGATGDAFAIVSILGIAAAVYLFILNGRLRQDAHSLTYRQR